MDKTVVVAITLIAYKLLLIGIGLWATSRNRNEEDFFLGGRGLGPLVAAISYSSSASSAWTLLGLSGAAYVLGVSIVWTAAGSIIGMVIAWVWVGPRLMPHTLQRRQITVTDFLAGSTSGPARRNIVVAASFIIVFSFVFYVAAQYQGAGNTFSSTFGLSMRTSIVLGALIIMIYTLLGGFWAVSITDTVQGLLMAFTAVLLPIAAMHEVGGWNGFLESLRAVSTADQLSLTAGNAGLTAIGLVAGGLSMAFGTFGQPHLLVRFMALRDEKALVRARLITIGWYAVVFTGMVLLGLVGHVLHQAVDNPETVFFVVTEGLFTPVLAGILLAAVLSAIMSTADSQLLVCASAIAHDLGFGGSDARRQLLVSRLAIVALTIAAVMVALFIPEKIFSRVLFAWFALGSAFGPTLFMRLAGQKLKPGGVLAAMMTGFSLAVIFYLLPNTPGDILERMAPFAVGLAMLFFAREKA